MLSIDSPKKNQEAIDFCIRFLDPETKQRYIFGRNEYAESLAEYIDVDGFIDDFTTDTHYLNKPVLKTEDIPSGAMVVNVVVLGRPVTVEKKLNSLKISNLDYFLFYRYSQLPLLPVTFWEYFLLDFKKNEPKYHWIFNLLCDNESRKIMEKLINFRLSSDLKYMKSFKDRQQDQYFEPFLRLNTEGETFGDIGGFDGETTISFIEKFPHYNAIYFFEPDEKNMMTARNRLSNFTNINYIKKGLSNTRETLKFKTDGSSSHACPSGTEKIEVDLLDNLVKDSISFIKMDIEGAEGAALEGGKNLIINYHPHLAVCVYHKGDDFWKIPEQILSYRPDYKIYLRHYTEGVVETVMYFVPEKSN